MDSYKDGIRSTSQEVSISHLLVSQTRHVLTRKILCCCYKVRSAHSFVCSSVSRHALQGQRKSFASSAAPCARPFARTSVTPSGRVMSVGSVGVMSPSLPPVVSLRHLPPHCMQWRTPQKRNGKCHRIPFGGSLRLAFTPQKLRSLSGAFGVPTCTTNAQNDCALISDSIKNRIGKRRPSAACFALIFPTARYNL